MLVVVVVTALVRTRIVSIHTEADASACVTRQAKMSHP